MPAIYSYDTSGQSSLTPTTSAASVCPTQSSYMSTSNRYDEISLKTATNMYYQSNHEQQTHLPAVQTNNSYYPSWSSNSHVAYDSATPNYSSSSSWSYATSGCYPDHLTSSSSASSAVNTNLTNSQHLASDHHQLNHTNLPTTCWSSAYGQTTPIGTNQVYYQ